MSCQNFWQRTLPIYTIGSQTHVLVRFFPFGCILVRFATARCRFGAFGTVLQMFMHDVVLEFFATNTPDPYHWTLNSCFGVFLSVWGHLEPFCYCMKLAAKCAKLVQLMQKFVPRCLVRIFATNAPDPHHWTLNSFFGASLSIWVHLELFRYCTKLGANGPTWYN